MQKSSLYLTFALLVAIFVAFYGCTKKVNGINNDTVVETPYSLFFSDTSGGLFVTNDGKTVKTLFKGDGFPCRAICTVDNNILWAKTNLYISTNNGVNFNHSYDSLASYPFTACPNGRASDLNQSMIINVHSWGQVFIASNNPDPSDYLGIAFSLNYAGIRGYWWGDIPDTAVPPATSGAFGYYGPPGSTYGINFTTFTLLQNGTLCGYDAMHNRNFYRTQHTLWHECTANPDSLDWPNIGLPTNRSGNPLPHRNFYRPNGTPFDSTAWYSYGHYNNRLIAIDNKGCNTSGAYYSDNNGQDWTQYQGLPTRALLCISSPFDEIALIGTDSAGLYFLNNNTGAWQHQINSGLGNNITVRNIAFKENILKNGTHQKSIFLATNQGIYQSTNGGNNWVKTIPGNFVAIY